MKATKKKSNPKGDSSTADKQPLANKTQDLTSQQPKQKKYYKSPFGEYFNILTEIDKGKRDSKEFGSIMILSLVEEVGEMARAYLAEHGRKSSNLSAQADETYEQELGDILLVILRFARIKKIDLHERLMYSLEKIRKRKDNPKGAGLS